MIVRYSGDHAAHPDSPHQLCPQTPHRYLENVPTIVPVLEKEYRNASRRLEETQVELHDLHPEKLKVGCCSHQLKLVLRR